MRREPASARAQGVRGAGLAGPCAQGQWRQRVREGVGVCGWQEYEISRHRWRQHVCRTAQVVASVCCRCYSPPLWPSSKESSDTVSQSSDTLSQSRSRRRTRSDECPCAIALFSRVTYGDEARAAGAGPVLICDDGSGNRIPSHGSRSTRQPILAGGASGRVVAGRKELEEVVVNRVANHAVNQRHIRSVTSL